MEMSTSYQIIFSNKNVNGDPEDDLRFYKSRDMSIAPQSPWMYEIFKNSMNSKIQAMGLTGLILIPFCTYYFELVILDFEAKHDQLILMD